jgi:hypothetical protein
LLADRQEVAAVVDLDLSHRLLFLGGSLQHLSLMAFVPFV